MRGESRFSGGLFGIRARELDTPGRARLIAACFDTWRAVDGVPKIHLSRQARGARRGRRGDWVRTFDFLDFLAVASGRPFDCMIEAKKKNLALFRLRRALQRARVMEEGSRRAA